MKLRGNAKPKLTPTMAATPQPSPPVWFTESLHFSFDHSRRRMKRRRRGSKRFVRYLLNYEVGGGGEERLGFKTLWLEEAEGRLADSLARGRKIEQEKVGGCAQK